MNCQESLFGSILYPMTATLQLLQPIDWKPTEYELLDSGDGEKLERFGAVTMVRPDPQIVWSRQAPEQMWRQAQARFVRTTQDKGRWQVSVSVPQSWLISWRSLRLQVELSPFKHTGVFPEQSAHWAWMQDQITLFKSQHNRPPKILNLFAYTGAASVAVAAAGAEITHVDASRSAIGWAKANQKASGLDERSIRWILDDVQKFVSREVRRGAHYDAIIMDPPVYGHGPGGERWEFKNDVFPLVQQCELLLSSTPLFYLVNAYAVSTSAITLGNMLSEVAWPVPSLLEQGELVLAHQGTDRLLSTGIWARLSTKLI